MSKIEIQEHVATWWTHLQKSKGAKAQLKRCASPEEAALHSEVHRLSLVLPRWIPLEAVATIAGVSAYIKNNTKLGFAKSLATHGRVPLSESRFRQLLSCRDWDELYRSMRRSITILDGQVNLDSFVETILLWNDEFRGQFKKPGKSIKFELSRSYYEEAIKHEKKSK